jgi:hypothetical protein
MNGRNHLFVLRHVSLKGLDTVDLLVRVGACFVAQVNYIVSLIRIQFVEGGRKYLAFEALQ